MSSSEDLGSGREHVAPVSVVLAAAAWNTTDQMSAKGSGCGQLRKAHDLRETTPSRRGTEQQEAQVRDRAIT